MAPSSTHSMASITILFRRSVPVLHRSPCSRSRCVSLSFLPLPCVRLSPLRSPHPCSKIASISGCLPFLRVPLQYGFLVRFMFSPEGFGSVFPSFPHCFFPFLASDLPTLVLLSPIHPQVIRLFPRALFRARIYRSDFAVQLLWPAGLPKRAHTTPKGAAKSTGQAAANKPFVQ